MGWSFTTSSMYEETKLVLVQDVKVEEDTPFDLAHVEPDVESEQLSST